MSNQDQQQQQPHIPQDEVATVFFVRHMFDSFAAHQDNVLAVTRDEIVAGITETSNAEIDEIVRESGTQDIQVFQQNLDGAFAQLTAICNGMSRYVGQVAKLIDAATKYRSNTIPAGNDAVNSSKFVEINSKLNDIHIEGKKMMDVTRSYQENVKFKFDHK